MLLLAACTSTSEGLCETAKDCLPGLSCQEGVCVGCGGDGECNAWEACTTDRRCELRAGRCTKGSHCESWETCGADNTCVRMASACTSSADCKAHESCDDTKKLCVLQAGRCNTANDCNDGSFWAATCGSDNQCHADALTGNDVLIWGTLAQGSCGADAISSVMSPTRPQVGFGCYTMGVFDDAILAPSGRVYYVDRAAHPARVKIFVPDAFKTEAGRKMYPPKGTDNDPSIQAPACAADEDVGHFIMQAETGAITYNCGATGGSRTFYGLTGDVVADGYLVLAWNADDRLLAWDKSSNLVVVSPQRTPIAITGLPTQSVVDARADATGFRLAVIVNIFDLQLWHVSNEGVANLMGAYGPVPENIVVQRAGVLDSAGAFFAEGYKTDVSSSDVVVKRPLDGSIGVTVYSEDSAPSKVNGGADYNTLFNYMHISYLFSGP